MCLQWLRGASPLRQRNRLAGSAAAHEQHALALQRLRTARETLEARIRVILTNKRDRERLIVELYAARKRRRDAARVKGAPAPAPSQAETAKLRRHMAWRGICDQSAGQLEQMAHAIERQTMQLENWAATAQTMAALRGGAAAVDEQTRLLGGVEAVDRLLERLADQAQERDEIDQLISGENARYEGLDDGELEDELQRLIDEEHIADQFPAEDVAAAMGAKGLPRAPTSEPVRPIPYSQHAAFSPESLQPLLQRERADDDDDDARAMYVL